MYDAPPACLEILTSKQNFLHHKGRKNHLCASSHFSKVLGLSSANRRWTFSRLQIESHSVWRRSVFYSRGNCLSSLAW